MCSLGGISGCIGWCAFDYNTHKQFGSGDRICYHGVMDMFRNPKLAAAVYASQQEEKPVLEVCSTLDKGDWPASVPEAVWAFTNADSVRVYRDGVLLREFLPDREGFPHLPHPPVRMTDFSGPELLEKEHLDPEAGKLLHELWAAGGDADSSVLLRTLKRKYGITPETAWALRDRYAPFLSGGPLYRFEALRDGTVAAAVELEPVKSVSLRLDAPERSLREEGMWTAAEVRITAVDQHGNRLWYAGDPLLLETEGPLEIIGPRLTALRGGAAGVWLRSTGEKGSGRLRVLGPGPARGLEFTVE
jgi:beta-galactosidase